jgi:hypothetical protein
VHWGFHKAWTANSFNVRLLAFVRGLVEGAAQPMRVLVTG